MKPQQLFIASVFGLLGLMGGIYAIAALKPAYYQTHWVSVRATSPNSWVRVCVKDKALSVAGETLYYSAKEVPMNECKTNPSIKTKMISQLESECPGGECDKPGGPTEGAFMKLLWENEQQKTAPGEQGG